MHSIQQQQITIIPSLGNSLKQQQNTSLSTTQYQIQMREVMFTEDDPPF